MYTLYTRYNAEPCLYVPKARSSSGNSAARTACDSGCPALGALRCDMLLSPHLVTDEPLQERQYWLITPSYKRPLLCPLADHQDELLFLVLPRVLHQGQPSGITTTRFCLSFCQPIF